MGLWQRVAGLLGRRDAAARTELERVLLEADFGPAATEEILSRLDGADGDPRAALTRAVTALLTSEREPATLVRAAQPPTVVLVAGVNGVGKTTTVAKLARRLQREGSSVLLAAADTFRAGAVDQLQIWAQRLGVPCVSAAESGSGDPAAVAFDAVAAGSARGVDTVLVDTAGRQHTDDALVEQLRKVVRVVGKRVPGAPHEALVVVDATTGQNAVSQVRAFAAAVPLTGLIVTKLDGSARGGAVVAVRRAVTVPIRFIGTGEGVDDLEPFDAARYAERLLAG